MKVFRASGDTESYQPLRLDTPKDGSIFTFHKRGEPFGDSWKPLSVTLTKIDNRKTRFKVKSSLVADFPELGVHACYTRRAIDLLGENYLRQYGELLPFKSTNGEEYFWFNCTNTIKAFDEGNATFEHRNPNGTIEGIERYAFFAKEIGNNDMFLDYVTRQEFVTDNFKARVEATGLTGMLFKQLWSDEADEPKKLVTK
jgi:hypothetical protein